MHVTAIIAAGGRGARFGGTEPKQLLAVGGRPILEWSVRAFLDHPGIHAVLVALPPSLAALPPAYLRSAGKPLRVVAGGERRQDSVANAFREAAAESDLIVIHDAARPFPSAGLISRTIAAAAESGAALAAVVSRDTVKRASRPDAGRDRIVAATLSRDTIFLAQTPQAFRRDVLRAAVALGDREGAEATDEATLVERSGFPVRLVDGEAANIKITTPEDLLVAEAIAYRLAAEHQGRGPRAGAGRAGIGYDLHRLVEGRPLILGGVTIPFGMGLLGHSDADAVCHAVTDAVLGGAAAGDIGRHFPDTDAAWKGASSIDLLRRAAAIVRGIGLEVGNVDVSVIAERPKLVPYVDAMRANIAAALGIAVDRVSVKGKTNEGVGELGRGEAIAVHAVVLLQSVTS
jgi:2-C-methyl-D-erythritol 4-phosphate cytidylyltransferase/2-C-methyl-D-erythritol 2,4-cyclodiphosphate synthase